RRQGMILYRVFIHVALLALAVPLAAAPAESLLEKLLRIAGLTAAPSQLKGPDDDVATGYVWLVNLDQQKANALTTAGGFRSPVFALDGTIFALQGDSIVRIPPFAGFRSVRVQDAIKLVGFDRATPEELVFLRSNAASPLGAVSMKTGIV